MPNIFTDNIIQQIKSDFGILKKIGNSNSLFEISSNEAIIYFRYSKISPHGKGTKAFYGLRKEDIDLMQGRKAFVCFVWDRADSPILLPFNQFESYFSLYPPASDGQYKVQLYFKPSDTEFYLAKVGKFNVDTFYGLDALYNIESTKIKIPELTHNQIQSLIGAIGIKKGFDIWYPMNDRNSIDYSIIPNSKIKEKLPNFNKDVNEIISEIDVIWMENIQPITLFEVEHSTPIYSGLLRFNDVLLTIPSADNFYIVADYDREGKFGREINRPTFRQNKLIDKVTFLNYENIYKWYSNIYGTTYEPM